MELSHPDHCGPDFDLKAFNRDNADRMMEAFRGVCIYWGDGWTCHSPTGERYWDICSSGFYIVGSKDLILYDTPDEAIDAFNKTVQRLLEGTTDQDICYFRAQFRPRLMEDGGRYYVFSRFILSRKPLNF